jgi:hypothetical protein
MAFTYGQDIPTGVLGAAQNVLRRVAVRNNSSATIADGVMVVKDDGSGTSDIAVRIPSAITDKVIGVTELIVQNPAGFTASSADPCVLGSAVVYGEINVQLNAADSVVRGDPVYFQCVTTGSGGTLRAVGTFGKTADNSGGADHAVLVKGEFMEAAAAGSMVRIFVNLG